MARQRRDQVMQAVERAYARSPDGLSNAGLYQSVGDDTGMSQADFWERTPVGSAGSPRSLPARTVRWIQQTMRHRGLLEKVPGERGLWRLTGEGKRRLCTVRRGVVLVAFHTDLGLALWADCRDALQGLDEPIMCAITSPPYCLSQPRYYGNVSADAYVDFLMEGLEPVVERLAPGGSLVLNLSNDIFMPRSPARHLYPERLVLALNDRFSLDLMDRLVWNCTTKPPGPIQWASLSRQQLNHGYEHLYWFCKDARQCRSDNRRVLTEHSLAHQRLMAAGGVSKARASSDGSHKQRVGAYSAVTAGRIPRNVLSYAATCGDQRRYKKAARALGLPAHGAPMPLRLADFLVRFLTEVGDLVVDPFGGSLTTAVACERSGRRWLTCDTAAEYLRGGATRVRDAAGFWLNPQLNEALGLPLTEEGC